MDRQTNGWTLLVPKVAIATEKTSKRQEMEADGLTQTNKRLEGDYKAQRELEGAREEIWRDLDNLFTNKRMDKRMDIISS